MEVESPMSAALDRTTDTPRVDEIADRHDGHMDANEANGQYNDLLDLARQLERELAEAKKPPPCQHTQRHGRVEGDKSEWWCAQCGKPMPVGYISIYGGGWFGWPK